MCSWEHSCRPAVAQPLPVLKAATVMRSLTSKAHKAHQHALLN